MESNNEIPVNTDVIASLLRSQITNMLKILQYIEEGNTINEYVDENIKKMEKDLRWMRKSYFNN